MSNADFVDFVPKDREGPRPGFAGLIAPALAWGLALAILAFVVPRFEVIFKDFGISLSWATMLVVGASRFSLALLGLVVVLLVADSIVRESLARRKDGRAWSQFWSTSMILLPMSALVFLSITLGSTLTSLLLKLSG
jgi:type II secretory pathway component PulF